jgi:hypothetical protein
MAKGVPFAEKITPFEEVEAMAKRSRGFKVSKSFKDHSVEHVQRHD